MLDGVRGEVRVADGQREGGRGRLSSAGTAPASLVMVVGRLVTAAAAHHEGLESANKNLQYGSGLGEFTQPKEPYFPQNFRMRTLDWLLGNVTE